MRILRWEGPDCSGWGWLLSLSGPRIPRWQTKHRQTVSRSCCCEARVSFCVRIPLFLLELKKIVKSRHTFLSQQSCFQVKYKRFGKRQHIQLLRTECKNCNSYTKTDPCGDALNNCKSSTKILFTRRMLHQLAAVTFDFLREAVSSGLLCCT